MTEFPEFLILVILMLIACILAYFNSKFYSLTDAVDGLRRQLDCQYVLQKKIKKEDRGQNNPVKLKIKLLNENAKLPTRGTPGSAGLDIYSPEDMTIGSEDIVKIGTGLSMEIPKGYTGLLMGRSSMGARGVRIAAGVNLIDSDYRDELFVCIRNDGEYPWHIRKGDRIAQLVIIRYLPLESEEVEKLSETEREGGFGSTGR